MGDHGLEKWMTRRAPSRVKETGSVETFQSVLIPSLSPQTEPFESSPSGKTLHRLYSLLRQNSPNKGRGDLHVNEEGRENKVPHISRQSHGRKHLSGKKTREKPYCRVEYLQSVFGRNRRNKNPRAGFISFVMTKRSHNE